MPRCLIEISPRKSGNSRIEARTNNDDGMINKINASIATADQADNRMCKKRGEANGLQEIHYLHALYGGRLFHGLWEAHLFHGLQDSNCHHGAGAQAGNELSDLLARILDV